MKNKTIFIANIRFVMVSYSCLSELTKNFNELQDYKSEILFLNTLSGN